jgi:hypothetical protein
MKLPEARNEKGRRINERQIYATPKSVTFRVVKSFAPLRNEVVFTVSSCLSHCSSSLTNSLRLRRYVREDPRLDNRGMIRSVMRKFGEQR